MTAHHELIAAVKHADMVISWQEALPRDEIPPRWMWPFPKKLEEWFDTVEAKRKDGSPTEDTTTPREGDNQFATRALEEMKKGRPRRPRLAASQN